MEPSASTAARAVMRAGAACALRDSQPAACEHGERRRRARKIETLPEADAACAQSPILLVGLDPFGDDPGPGPRRDLEQGLHQVLLDQAPVDVLDQRDVDLEEVRRQL